MTGDFDGDGRPDLAAAAADSQDIAVLLGNGDGTFRAQRRVGAGADPWSLVTGDFNGDGRPDLAGNFLDEETAVLVGNGDGTFQAPVPVGGIALSPLAWRRGTSTAIGDPTWPPPSPAPIASPYCWAAAMDGSRPRPVRHRTARHAPAGRLQR